MAQSVSDMASPSSRPHAGCFATLSEPFEFCIGQSFLALLRSALSAMFMCEQGRRAQSHVPVRVVVGQVPVPDARACAHSLAYRWAHGGTTCASLGPRWHHKVNMFAL